MSRKSVIKQLKLVQDQSLEEAYSSPAVDIIWLDNVGIQVELSDVTTDMTISVEVSNDHEVYPDGSVRNQGNWNIVTNPDGSLIQQVVTAGAPASIYFSCNQLDASYVRVSVVPDTTGDGTMDVTLSAKAV